MASNSGIVKLNVGGTIFHTSKSTLTRYAGFFKTILETNVPITKDETGAFFIDRDPTHFQLILNFMRGCHVELPTCEKKIKEISEEAQYYLLTGLVELCSKPVQYKPDDEIFKILNSKEEKDSVVLNSKKPVLIISSEYSISDFVNNCGYNEWKQLIKKHSPKWNIFFSRAKEESWCIHYDGKKFLQCSTYTPQKYQCGHPYVYDGSNYFIHLEYHMNRCLTHPENMDLKYKEYSRFLNQ